MPPLCSLDAFASMISASGGGTWSTVRPAQGTPQPPPPLRSTQTCSCRDSLSGAYSFKMRASLPTLLWVIGHSIGQKITRISRVARTYTTRSDDFQSAAYPALPALLAAQLK